MSHEAKTNSISRGPLWPWAVLAVITGSWTLGLFPFPYFGLLAFLLLPVAVLCWIRVARLAGGRMLTGLAIATILLAVVVFRWLKDVMPLRA